MFPLKPRLNAGDKAGAVLWVVVVGLLLFGAAGCQTDAVDAGVNRLMDAPPVETAVAAAPTAVQPVVYTVAAPESAPEGENGAPMPSFSLADPATATPVPSVTPQPAVQETAVPTPTPQPTFTPPALPLTSPDEHYWFRRPVAEGGVVWTDKVYPYGSTRSGQLRPHHGVEFNVPYNTEILAVASGTVVVAGSDDSDIYGPEPNFYGKLVVIEHDSRWREQPVYTLYGHLNEVLVTVGQRVESQEVIAISGATGVADGPHLHFEVRVGLNDYDHTRNPLLWLYPFPDRGTVAGRVTWPGGEPAEAVPITLRRVDAPSRYAATTSYFGNGVNGDDVLNENFAIDDVDAGFYEIEIKVGDTKFTEEFWVFPYQTSFVEITLSGE